MSYLILEASPYNCYCVVTRRHMRVCVTLTLNVHIKGLDHLKIKFLHYYLVTVPFFLSFVSFFCEAHFEDYTGRFFPYHNGSRMKLFKLHLVNEAS